MCYRPLHIKNGMCHYDAKKDPFYYEVPCGKCADCQRDRQTEWYVRSFYHWQHVKSLGGMAFFYTLTFNNDNLPNYNGLDCFSYELVMSFCKRLKERLARKYRLHLDYLISSEYGELYKRPHHHANFFIDGQLMPWTFYNEVQSAWTYGFVYAGTDGGVITSPAGILYVTKYITKDSSFIGLDKQIEKALFEDYARYYDSWYLFNGDSSCPDNFSELCKRHRDFVDRDFISFYNDFRREYHRKSAFKLSSTKFGLSMVDRHDMIDYQKDTILIPQGNKFKSVSLPRYALRHLYYDRVPNERDGKRNKFVLNVAGKQHLLDTLDCRIDERASKYEEFFKTTRMTDFQFQNIKSHFKFESNGDLRYFLDHLVCDWRKLAIYNIVYRNRFAFGNYDYFTEYKDFMSDVFSFLEDKNLSCISSWDTAQVNYINNNLFNFKPEFFVYEQLSLLYTQMACQISKERAELLSYQNKCERALRDLIKIKNQKIA